MRGYGIYFFLKRKTQLKKFFLLFTFLRQKSTIQVFFPGLCQKYLTFLLGLYQFSDRNLVKRIAYMPMERMPILFQSLRRNLRFGLVRFEKEGQYFVKMS